MSTTVTVLPKRANDWASSQPIGPPPMTTSRAGRVVRVKIVSLVRKPASASPGTGGTPARPPVAMTARRKRRRGPPGPPTSISSGETKRPSPRKTSTPSPAKRRALSLSLIFARSRRIRAMAAPKSSPPAVAGPPNPSALRRAASQERAARITPFEGTQPMFRQSPPIKCRSTIAARAPRPAEPAAETSPAVPAPIATRW